MQLTSGQRAFIDVSPSAAMITVGGDGYAKAVRVGVALVDGLLWSSGTADRLRTWRLRQDPKCTLFVFGTGHQALTLETTVTIIEGGEAVPRSVELFRVMQGRPDGPLVWYGEELDEEMFRRKMLDQKRLIYQFEVIKAYGVA
jgi:Pyridoxamine 5'-phosphate oxidase